MKGAELVLGSLHQKHRDYCKLLTVTKLMNTAFKLLQHHSVPGIKISWIQAIVGVLVKSIKHKNKNSFISDILLFSLKTLPYSLSVFVLLKQQIDIIL